MSGASRTWSWQEVADSLGVGADSSPNGQISPQRGSGIPASPPKLLPDGSMLLGETIIPREGGQYGIPNIEPEEMNRTGLPIPEQGFYNPYAQLLKEDTPLEKLLKNGPQLIDPDDPLGTKAMLRMATVHTPLADLASELTRKLIPPKKEESYIPSPAPSGTQQQTLRGPFQKDKKKFDDYMNLLRVKKAMGVELDPRPGETLDDFVDRIEMWKLDQKIRQGAPSPAPTPAPQGVWL